MAKLIKRTGTETHVEGPTDEEINEKLEAYGFALGQLVKFSSVPGGQINSANKGTIVGISEDGSITVRDAKNNAGRCLTPDRIAPR